MRWPAAGGESRQRNPDPRGGVMDNAEVNAFFWTAMVKQAESGDVVAARDVLVNFAETVEQTRLFREPEQHWSGPIPWVGADYLAKAFRKILDHAEPAQALRLVSPKVGRHKGAVVTHNLEALAAAFFLLRRFGVKAEEANRALSASIGADRATIYRARQRFAGLNRKVINGKRIGDELLKASLKPYAREFNSILKRRKK
jgi:hypothetical protein